MSELRLLADEHVDSAYVTILRSNGYAVAVAGESYPPGTTDDRLLEVALENERVILTNDRDFVSMARTYEHSGILVYDQGTKPRVVLTAVERLERYIPADERTNELFWLSDWQN